MWTMQQAADALGCSASEVMAMVALGMIKGSVIRLSPVPHTLVPQDEVLALKRQREQGAGVAKAAASAEPQAAAPSPVKTGRRGRARE